MPRSLGHRWIAFFAFFAIAVLLPLRANASIVPVCENDVASMMAPPPSDPICEIVTTVSETTGETSAAPICDPRGATALAPPRILPVADARIEATPSCGADGLTPFVTPNHRGGSDALGPALAIDYATLGSHFLVPPAAISEAPDFIVEQEAERSGFERRVEHPPRRFIFRDPSRSP
jgi:hypothetical protein